MVYETIAKGIDYVCKNTKAVATAGVITLASILGGCTTVQSQNTPYAQVDSRDQLKAYRQKAESYNKDKVINPSEVPEILADKDALKAFREGVKGDDKIAAAIREEATSIEGVLDGYLNSLHTDKRLTSKIILVTKRDATSSNRARGANTGDHIAYSGTASDHITDLGVKATDIYATMQADGSWGYEPGTIEAAFAKEQAGDRTDSERIKRQMATGSVEIMPEFWVNVPKHFPGGEIRAKDGTRYSAKKFERALANNEIVAVRLVYELEFKEGEKTEGQKLLDQIEKAKEEKAEQPPKPQPRPRPSKEEKKEDKGKGIDNFGVDDD